MSEEASIREKVISALLEKSSLTTREISNMRGLNPRSVQTYLSLYNKAGIVQVRRSGRIRRYSLTSRFVDLPPTETADYFSSWFTKASQKKLPKVKSDEAPVTLEIRVPSTCNLKIVIS